MSRMTRPGLAKALAASRIVRIHDEMVRLWHEREAAIRSWDDACRELPLPAEPVERFAAAIARINTFQWHEEDRARDTDATDAVIAAVKRSIDKSNQRRVDAIEAMDLALERLLDEAGARPDASLPLNSETPASLVDRLSILILKLYHMAEQKKRKDISAEQRSKFSAKLKTLTEQRGDLMTCLDELARGVLSGERRFKTYPQFKMYNDPETNPYIKTGASPAKAR